MIEIEFWKIIDQCRRDCLGHGKKIPELLEEKLLKLSVNEVIEFDGFLIEWLEKSYSNELWAVYSVATGWTNIERFDNFRVWLVAMGQDYLEKVVETPEILLHGFSSHGAEYIGSRVRSRAFWVLERYPYTSIHPQMAISYSRRFKLIGNPVSSQRYQELRDKYARLLHHYGNYEWGLKENSYFLNSEIQIHAPLLQTLIEQAQSRNVDVNRLMNEILEDYLGQNKGGSN